MTNSKTIANLFAVCAIFPFLQCCTITKLDHGNGQVETSFTFLSPVNEVKLPPDGAYFEAWGIGTATLAGQTTIGAFDIKALSISPDCRLVVIAPTAAQTEAWHSVLNNSGPLCSPSAPKGDTKRNIKP